MASVFDRPLEPRSAWALHLPSDLEHPALDFLNNGGQEDPYSRFQKLLERFAAVVGGVGADSDRTALLALLEKQSDEEQRQARLKRIERIRGAFTASTARDALMSYCANLCNGCEGGNWDSGLWFCGLEWGGGWTDPESGRRYINLDNFQYPAASAPDETAQTEDKLAEWLDAYRFNWYLARFLCRFFMWPVQGEDHGNFAKAASRRHAFTPEGIGAKLNIFPLSRAADSEWGQLSVRWQGVDLGRIADLSDIFPNLESYKNMAVEARRLGFQSRIAKNASEGRPTVVIGIGLQSRRAFVDAFGADAGVTERVPVKIEGGVKILASPIREVLVDEDGARRPAERSWLITIPFFYGGPASLAAYQKLDAAAAGIRAFLGAKGIRIGSEGLS